MSDLQSTIKTMLVESMRLQEALSDDDQSALNAKYWEKRGSVPATTRHSSGNQPTISTHKDHPGIYIVGGDHAFKKAANGNWDHVGTVHSAYENDATSPFGRKQVYGKIEIRKNK